jgi:hypothetical protein
MLKFAADENFNKERMRWHSVISLWKRPSRS